jgi:glutathione-regulated potassium-efflux system ancillary protein KefC/glutathione-regulated potassium-efflux system protein KefB
MSVNLGLIVSEPVRIAAIVASLMLTKAVILFVVARIAGQSAVTARSLAATLSQGGEFAFVLFAIAVDGGIVEAQLASTLVIAVTISMALTPLTMAIDDALRRRNTVKTKEDYEKIEPDDAAIIIAGFGRVGHIVARTLTARGIHFTALDISSEQIEVVRRFGNNKAYYGDASRLDMLRAAKAQDAKIFVLAIDDIEASVHTAEMVKKHFPNLKIFARVRNRFHAHRLMDIGVDFLIRETLGSALELAENVMLETGVGSWEARDTINTFRAHDEQTMVRQHAIYHDESQLIQTSRDAAQELQDIMESDRESQPSADHPVFSPGDVR